LVSPPVVRGDALVGRTLTSTEGQWTGSAPLTFAWVWLRCREDVCTPIDGAASTSYTLTGDDVGFRVRSRVTATNEFGSGSESSAPTDLVSAPSTL
jgi:hypothetical protein